MIWLTLLLNKLKPLLTSLKFWLITGLCIFAIISVKQCKTIRENKKENNRLERNIKNINQDLTVEKTKSGKLMYSFNALSIKKDEIDQYNNKLKSDLKDMGIKLKNTQSVLNMNLGYGRKIEYIPTEKIISEYIKVPGDTVFMKPNFNQHNLLAYKFLLNDNDSEINGQINIPYIIDSSMQTKYKLIDDVRNPFLSNVEFKFNDSLLVVSELEYKRVWLFFKRPIGIKTHVRSNNKYFNLDKVYNYQIVK